MNNFYLEHRNLEIRGQCSSEHKQKLKCSRAFLAGIPSEADFERETQNYFERYAAYPPDHFLETTAKKSRRTSKAWGSGDGWAARLWSTFEEPHAYTVHSGHLGLPLECANPVNFYCKGNVDRWKSAIKASFTSPLHWKLELAERVHAHITADGNASLFHLRRGGELAKPIYNYEGWLFYLAKPSAQWNARNLALWLRARRRGRLPRLSGTQGVPNRQRFHAKPA